MIECSSCGKQKNELTPSKSRLRPSMTLNLCNDCISMKREPRWLIIIVGREGPEGHKRAVPFVKSHRYVGAPIQWVDIL